MSWSEWPYLDSPITTFFSGFRPTDNLIINAVHISLFVLLIIVFFIPVFIQFDQTKTIVFSFFLMLFMAIHKITLFFLYKFQKFRDLSNSLISLNRSLNSSNSTMNDSISSKYYTENNNLYHHRNSDYKSCTGDDKKDIFFTSPPKVIHSLVSLILTFSVSFFTISLNNLEFVTFIQKSLSLTITAASIYSMIQYPIVDPYSTTINDNSNAFCRPFFITICGVAAFTFNLISEKYRIITIPVFDLNLNFFQYRELFVNIFLWLIISSPFLILFGFVGHPKTTLIWLFEWINMYAFGQSGVSGLLDAFINFVRGVVSVVSVSLLLRRKTELWTLTLSLCILFATLQFPIPPSRLLFRNHFIFMVFSILVPSFVVYSVMKLATIKHRTICMIILFCSFFLDWVLPQILSNQRYFIFHFRVMTAIRYIEFIRLFTPLFFAPFYAVYLIDNQSPRNIPYWMSAFLMTQICSIALSEPHVFTVAVAISFGVIENDLGWSNNHIVSAFLGLWIARKCFSIFGYFEFLSIARRYPSVQGCEDFHTCLLVFVLNHLPMPDIIIKLPVLLWGLVTGSSFATPMMLYYAILPSPPRPNLFWDDVDSRKMSPEMALTSQLSEHPVEAPVYASASRALCVSLRKMIRSGRLGRVTAGDIFFFECDDMGAFVHIIANNALSTKFQLRGLEYSSQTPCHRSEKFSLVTAVNFYNKFPNFIHSLQSRVTVFEIRSLEIPISMYEVTFLEIQEAFIGCKVTQIRYLFYVTLCYILSKNSVNLSSVKMFGSEKSTHHNTSNGNSSFRLYSGVLSDIVEARVSESHERRVYNLYDAIMSAIIVPSMNKINDTNLCLLFNEEYRFSGEYNWINSISKEVQNSFYEAIRFSLLVVTLTSADLISGLEDHTEIVPTLTDIQNEYVCTSIHDRKFQMAFESAKKTLVSMVFRNKKPVFLRFTLQRTKWDIFELKKECVRAFWTNEARSQMFFGEDSPERNNIQANAITLSNMILQSCNLPIGYPGFVSPILTSYDFPMNTGPGNRNRNHGENFSVL
ncbi:hypothetical protein TRFO_14665 [Tritrichomonas foetus]|uniref:Pecanex C-terminal domain-containing protein n=1 Tax=Tritrichomonas foetus TaxID=1144522 RepID=A0A1J4KUU1_9EUKA|nr:hypothetical protein TRFO_14665 [Tritrichomonas foetus]|eukprot:OHT14882.1 hypothetical protein TRFO_14665 [Tritrichomonas foetus]